MKKLWLIILLSIFIIITGLIGYYYYNLYASAGESNQDRVFEIIEGESTSEIAHNLQEKGFIRSPMVFMIYVGVTNTPLLPGIYYLKETMNLPAIVNPISKGKTQENKITIIEGWSVKDIAQYLDQRKITSQDDFLLVASGKEGYLFPDTYRIKENATSAEIIAKMLENFQERTKNLLIKPETVVLASIVEREAKFDEDRAKIAGVYQNRLDEKMNLEADPTVQYAKGNWETISQSDYKGVNSPYNTYLFKGLPPGPICNPGLASIKAALTPEKVDYFYFFHLKTGQTIYSTTSQEHQTNLLKYQLER